MWGGNHRLPEPGHGERSLHACWDWNQQTLAACAPPPLSNGAWRRRPGRHRALASAPGRRPLATSALKTPGQVKEPRLCRERTARPSGRLGVNGEFCAARRANGPVPEWRPGAELQENPTFAQKC